MNKDKDVVASLCCVPFSLVLFLTVCVLMVRVLHLGKKSSFSKISMQLSVLTFILEELSLICSHLDKASSKSCKNVNCIMIVALGVRCY